MGKTALVSDLRIILNIYRAKVVCMVLSNIMRDKPSFVFSFYFIGATAATEAEVGGFAAAATTFPRHRGRRSVDSRKGTRRLLYQQV